MLKYTDNKKRTIFLHILACLAFLTLPFIFSPDLNGSVNLFMIRGFRNDFVFHLFLVGFFYLNYYILCTRFFFRKRYILYAFLLLGILLSMIYVSGFIANLFPSAHHFRNGEFQGLKRMHHATFRRSLLGFDSGKRVFEFILLAVLSILFTVDRKRKELENEKTKLELSYLKAQINPHFLFNTLNSIFALALEKSDNTAAAVSKLSGMMRYILSEAEKEFVSLENELNYIGHYIDLQKLRLDESIELEYNIHCENHSHTIAPLILISLIENAFKYGVNPDEKSSILIELNCDETYLFMLLRNNKVNTVLSLPSEQLGIANTRKRLESLYPGKYSLEILDEADTFEVRLKIQLT